MVQVASKLGVRKSRGAADLYALALRKYLREIHFNATMIAVLSLLEQAPEELHAYQLGQLLASLSPEKFPANQAAIYPALRTLRRLKLVVMRQRKNGNGGQRQHFRITESGRAMLAQLLPAWKSSRAFLDLLDPSPATAGHRDESTTPGERVGQGLNGLNGHSARLRKAGAKSSRGAQGTPTPTGSRPRAVKSPPLADHESPSSR